MMRRHVRHLVIAGLLIAAGLGWSGCGIAAFGLNARYSEELDWTLDGVGVVAIDAQTSNGAIRFTATDSPRVVVRAVKTVRARNEKQAKAFAQQVKIRVEREGNRVRIVKEHPRPPRHVNLAVRYDIRAPGDVDVTFRTSNGAIQILGVAGRVEALTSNGAIELQGGRGEVNLHTSNGRITFRGVTGQIHVQTSNGAIEGAVTSLTGESVFSTSNGSIDLTIEEGITPLTATTSNGNIDVVLPTDFSGRLDARTSNGRVRSDFPVLMRVKESPSHKNRLVGQIGEGVGPLVTLRSSNGSIHLGAH